MCPVKLFAKSKIALISLLKVLENTSNASLMSCQQLFRRKKSIVLKTHTFWDKT